MINIERIGKKKKFERGKKKDGLKKQQHSNQIVKELSGRKCKGTPSYVLRFKNKNQDRILKRILSPFLISTNKVLQTKPDS